MMATVKAYACYTVKIYKNFQNGGRAPGAPILDPPLRFIKHSPLLHM